MDFTDANTQPINPSPKPQPSASDWDEQTGPFSAVADPYPRALSVAGPIPSPASVPTAGGFNDANTQPIVEDEQPLLIPAALRNSPLQAQDIAQLQSEPSDQAFDNAVRLSKGDLRWPLTAFKGVSPDVAAQVDQLAKSNGTTYSVADAGKDDLAVAQQAKDIYASLSATDDKGNFIYPNTIGWIQDPVNLAKSRDDLDALKGVEDVVRNQQQAGEGYWSQWVRSMQAGGLRIGAEMLRTPSDTVDMIRGAGNWMADSIEKQPVSLSDGSSISAEPRTAPSWSTAPLPDWLSNFFGAVPWLKAQADADSPVTSSGQDFVSAVRSGNAGDAFRQASENLENMVPAVVGGIYDPALGLALGSVQSGGAEYDKDLDEGKSGPMAGLDAAGNAAINAVGMKTFGVIGQLDRMKALFSAPITRQSLSTVAGTLARRFATSTAQGAPAQMGMQYADDHLDYATGNSHALDNEGEKLLNAALIGAMADGLISGGGGLLHAVQTVRAQREGARTWDGLSGVSGQSKLRERDPNAYAEFVNQTLLANGRPLTANVAADKVSAFFQGNNEGLANFASDMGTTPAAIADAANTGGTMDLPIGAYQAKYAGTPLDNSLMKDLRFTAGGPTGEEAEQTRQQVQEMAGVLQTEIARQSEGDGTLPVRLAAIRDTMMAPKEEGGSGYSADEADSQLSVLTAGMREIAGLRNESVEQTVNRLGLELDTTSEVVPNDDGTVTVRNQGGNDEERAAKRSALQQQVPVEVDTTPFGTETDPARIRDIAKGEFKKQASQGPVTTTDGRSVELPNSGFREAKSHSADTRVMKIVPGLRDMLSRATPLWSEAPKKGESGNTKAYHNYAAKALLDGKNVYSRLVVREDVNGHFHYDHDVSSVEEIENPAVHKGQPGSSPDGNPQFSRPLASPEGQSESPLPRPIQEVASPTDKNRLRAWWHEVNLDDTGAPPQALHQGNRGAIVFRDGRTTIHLFKNADMSTFLHETGHLFLHELKGAVEQGFGDDQTRVDLQTLQDFAGGQFDRDGEEKIAKAFEAYLREGKAPSVELSSAFARFRSWLTTIYRSITALGVQPTDEVRQVFDRMLASEEDMAEAEQYYSRKGEVLNLLTADEAEKMPVRQKLAKAQMTALDKQVSIYLKSYLKAVGGTGAIREAARAEVENNKVYRALDAAKEGKISRESIADALGAKDGAAFEDQFPKLVTEGGEHTLESLAAAHGFESPETLADVLRSTPSKAEAVKNYTKRLVQAKEDELRDEISKRGATPADGVMHSPESLSYLIAETQLMAQQVAKSTGTRVHINERVYRDAASEAIARMPVRRASRYDLFAKNEARLAKQVVDLAKRGQWAEALAARQKQLAQHYMVQEAIRVADERAAIARRYMRTKLEARLKNVDLAYVDPVRQVLSTYGLSDAKPSAPFDLARIGDMDKALYSLLPEWLVRGENAGDYRNLTWGQLQAVDAAARSLMEFGSNQRKADLDTEAKTIGAIVEESVGNIAALKKRNPKQFSGSVAGNAFVRLAKSADWLKSHIMKAQVLFDILDNFSVERNGHAGIMAKLFKGMNAAEHAQSEAQREVYEKAQPHLRTLATAAARIRKQYGRFFAVDGLEKPQAYRDASRANWSPEELISYLLNTGAEGNISALKNSFNHGPAEFDRAARFFSTKELSALDGLRHSLDKLFDPLDATTRKIFNRPVEKVEAVPQDLTDMDGKPVHLKGGYWPLVFDYDINRRTNATTDQEIVANQTRSMLRASKPDDGMTKSRVIGHSLAPRLDMGVFGDHVDDTTRFIHLSPIVRDLDRVMQNETWKKAVIETVGLENYDQTRDWLQKQANPGRKETNAFMRGADKVADWTRSAGTASALGANFVAGLKWRTSMINSAVALGGWKYIARGFSAMGTKGALTSTLGLSNTKTWEEMVAKSKLLGPREAKGIRDIRDDVEKMKWNQSEWRIPGTDKTFTVSDLKHGLYSWAKMNDRAVVAVVWAGAYAKYHGEMGEPGATESQKERAAIEYADSIIQKSQPTSLNVDMNSVQRNQGAFLKLFTMFMTYPYTIANRFMYQAKALDEGAITKQQYTSHVVNEVFLEPLARAFITSAAIGTLPAWYDYFLYPMENLVAGIPGMNTLFNEAKHQFDPSELSPAFDGLRKLARPVKDIHEGDIAHLAWDVARLTEYVAHIPALNVAKKLMDWDAAAHGQKNAYK